MQRNVGALDRAFRVALGLALLALVFVGPQSPWGLLGAIPLVTGLSGVCPLYQALGISTNRRVPGRRDRSARRARRRA